ncbi:MAG: 4-hydroxy-tetrahydrodipicolinate reductase [Firmicutes bacterium]|nr:4-hydroxy-tetrahydrodipicolinate reductase [candidate division NPL-UPA2 bacterium]
MGSLIAGLIAQTKDMRVTAASEHASHPLVGKRLDAAGEVYVCTTDELQECRADVLVDFTRPEVCMRTMAIAKAARLAVVSGTTGLDAAQVAVVQETARHAPVLFSPNMSVGIHAFYRALESLARELGETYDAAVVELHHKHKLDAPSGTAKRMLEFLSQGTPCHSLRIGEIVGEHQVHFAGLGERIVLTHHALSRETFAHGALRAIRFVHGRAPGLYTMFDCLEEGL